MRDNQYLVRVGQQIRTIRKAAGLSLRKLESQYGIEKGYQSRLENGEFDIHLLRLKKLADIFGVDVKDFL